jgi:chemotaxis regulatin CheY-phosphate phosphatase CheZ
MKKEMFEKWYESYGRNLVIETCPYDYKEMEDDVWNKELRKKAKKIFSSLYNMFSNEMVNKLDIMQNEVYNKLYEIMDDYERAMNQKNNIEESIKDITDKSTKLYDFYFANKIDKEYFEEMKTYYGERLNKLKTNLGFINQVLHEIKITKKETESLLITE